MSSTNDISTKMYFLDPNNTAYIQSIFDHENFMSHARFDRALGSSSGYNPPKVLSLLRRINAAYDAANQDITQFIDNRFALALFNFILEETFAPHLEATRGRHLFNASNRNQLAAISDRIMAIFNSSIDYSKLDTLETQFVNLDDVLYRFGHQLSTLGTSFHLTTFKSEFSKQLFETFYPYLYFRHIQQAKQFCDDFKCKRVYILAKYVFVYYLCMAIYLLIFSCAENISTYMSATNSTQSMMEAFKGKFEDVMYGVLLALEQENVLDLPGAQNVSTLAQYYQKLKHTSKNNVENSFLLNQKKNSAVIMQNNLGNYTNHEAIAYKELVKTKSAVVFVIILMIVIIFTLIALISSKNFMAVYLLSGLTLLALAIYALVGAIKSNRSSK